MSSNVIKIAPSASDQLRLLADQIDAGDYPHDGVTIIAGTAVFHCSDKPDSVCAVNTVWDCNYAISKLMNRIHGQQYDQ